MKWVKRISAGVIAAVVIASGGFVGWTQVSRYPAAPSAQQLAQAHTDAKTDWLVFRPAQPNGSGLLVYPGGLVDAAAYAPIAQRIAEQGALVVIVPMPLDLAVLAPDRGLGVFQAFPEVRAWAVGGQSLGGTMAAQLLRAHPELTRQNVRGLVLWGSRLSADIDVSNLPIRALSIYGTLDGVAPKGLTNADRLNGLPAGAGLVAIEGGNHGMFGEYGAQRGDNPAAIMQDQAEAKIAAASAELLAQLR
jgi:dienelactone hydrolase